MREHFAHSYISIYTNRYRACDLCWATVNGRGWITAKTFRRGNRKNLDVTEKLTSRSIENCTNNNIAGLPWSKIAVKIHFKWKFLWIEENYQIFINSNALWLDFLNTYTRKPDMSSELFSRSKSTCDGHMAMCC